MYSHVLHYFLTFTSTLNNPNIENEVGGGGGGGVSFAIGATNSSESPINSASVRPDKNGDWGNR